MAQQAATRAVGRQGYATHVVALHIVDAVVVCQPVIEPGVLAVEQAQYAAILAYQIAKQQLGFLAKCVEQLCAEGRILRLCIIEFAQQSLLEPASVTERDRRELFMKIMSQLDAGQKAKLIAQMRGR